MKFVVEIQGETLEVDLSTTAGGDAAEATVVVGGNPRRVRLEILSGGAVMAEDTESGERLEIFRLEDGVRDLRRQRLLSGALDVDAVAESLAQGLYVGDMGQQAQFDL